MASTKKTAKKKTTAAKKDTIAAKNEPIAAKKNIPAKSTPRSLSRGAVPAAAEAEKTTLDTVYIVDNSNNQVTLEVNAGEQGQTSDMTIKLDDTVIAEKIAGDFAEKPLGTNKQLNGKKLSIAATIADTSQETNLTSLTIHLKGGVSANDFPLFKTVDQNGDSEDYLCLIEFFNPLL
jgi:hypothetical protein